MDNKMIYLSANDENWSDVVVTATELRIDFLELLEALSKNNQLIYDKYDNIKMNPNDSMNVRETMKIINNFCKNESL
jgi:hypothetical protein